MNKFKLLTKNNLLTSIGILAGGVAGFLYWRFVAIGGLLLSIFRTDKKQKNNTQT